MRHFKGISIIKKRERGHRRSAEDVRSEHIFAGIRLFFRVIGVDREQRFAHLNLFPHFVVDDESDCMIHRVGFFSPTCA